MSIKYMTIIGGVAVFPILARAEGQAAVVESSSWSNLFWGVIPILILVAVFIPLIRRMQKPLMKRSQLHMDRQVQHMEHVERSLERIIELLEKRG